MSECDHNMARPSDRHYNIESMERFNDQDHFNAHYSFESMEQFNSQGHFNAQAQDNQVNAQAQTHQFDVQSQHLLPGHVVMPGPPPVSQSVIAIWTATTQAARSNISQNYHPVQQEQIRTTEEERCWLFLTALQRERELEEMANELDNAWRELNEVRRLLGIRRN
ncbi:hypothetical protein BD769DRAFT_1392029 [Suillus cothurnatus]|nr:hypothetical protein BD769DRAFT_1392029 [Suillus cothurnatus]